MYNYTFVSYKYLQFPAFSLELLANGIHRLSSLETPAEEIPIRPIRRPSRQRDRTDRFQSVARLAQRQLAVSDLLHLHRDSYCRATLT